MKKIVSNIDEEIGYLYSQLRYHNDCFEADLLPKLKKSRPIFRIQNILHKPVYKTRSRSKRPRLKRSKENSEAIPNMI